MPDIELPTYKVILPNEVFGKRAKPLNHPATGELPATLVTKLTKFKTPTQDEVIELIKTVARKGGSFSEILPPSLIKRIAKGDEEALQHLKSHYPDSNLIPGKVYVETRNGIVPNMVLDSARDLFKEVGSKIYERAIEKTGAQEWNLRIKLQNNGAFPDSLELEYLLSRGVKDSDVFSAQGDFNEYETIANQIRLLYKALYSPEIITQMKDSSYQFLEQRAASTIKETARCIASKKFIGSLGEVLEKIIGGIKEDEKDKSRKPFEDCSGSSLN